MCGLFLPEVIYVKAPQSVCLGPPSKKPSTKLGLQFSPNVLAFQLLYHNSKFLFNDKFSQTEIFNTYLDNKFIPES